MEHPFLRPPIQFIIILVIVCSGFILFADAQSAQPPVYAKFTTGPTMPPEADFFAKPLSGTAPLTVRFYDNSLNNPESWLWDFDGDGRIDEQVENPEFTYREPGTYTVSLMVSNSAGKDEETKKGYITVTEWVETPVADFSADVTSGTVPLTVRFSDRSTGDPYYREWDLDGDGRIDSSDQYPVHTYSQPGFFTVRLTVWTNSGEDDEVKPEYIAVLPGEITEEPFLPPEGSEEEPYVTYQTPVTTVPSLESPRESRTVPPLENPGFPPNNIPLLILFLTGAALVTAGLLFRRARLSQQSSDVHPDLHFELSGGIDFGDVLPPVEDAAEVLLSGDEPEKGGGGR